MKDYEYRYYMNNGKLYRFHVEQEEYWENPRNEFDGYFTKMYMRNREYDCTDDKIDVESNADAIRMMIFDADIDIVEAVDSGKIPRMEIKYDDEYEGYELWVDGYCEVDEDYCDKSWLADDIAEYLTIDDLEKASDDLYVIALDFGYQGCLNSIYNSDRLEPDGYIWTSKNDMIKAGFKDMSSEDLRKKAYEILNAEIETENLWATGNVFWYETEMCTDIINRDDDCAWTEEFSCGGFIVDGYKAYDEIYDMEVGHIPYHDDLDDLYDWPEFKISFDDYFNALSEAESDDVFDNTRESLKGKIDWSAKSLADCITDVMAEMASAKDYMNTIIGMLNDSINRFEDGSIYTIFDGASTNYHKTYEHYSDMEYRLRELRSLE